VSPENAVDAAVARLLAAGADICQADSVPWIAGVEQRLGLSYPRSFRILVTRYIFGAFEVGPVELFANLGDGTEQDLTAAPFSDRYMSPWLLAHRFLQFGRPSTGSYDPVCFDFDECSDEPRVVRLDHEDILQERPQVQRIVIASNFLALLEMPPDA
jgi:hypothetical protein